MDTIFDYYYCQEILRLLIAEIVWMNSLEPIHRYLTDELEWLILTLRMYTTERIHLEADRPPWGKEKCYCRPHMGNLGFDDSGALPLTLPTLGVNNGHTPNCPDMI